MVKRTIVNVIDAIYTHLEQNNGLLYKSHLRKVVSHPETALKIIKKVQGKPYIYFLKQETFALKPGKREYDNADEIQDPEDINTKQHVILKLSTHKRDPHFRYLQLEEVIDYLTKQQKEMESKPINKAEVLLTLNRTIEGLKKIHEKKLISYDESI